MSALHSALKSLGPVDFADIPSDQSELHAYVTDLFSQSQLILESIPLGEPSSPEQSVTDKPVEATSASDIKLSNARSAPPVDEYASLQKEWGKPIKLGAKENKLGMSVYKTSAKDGRGAWFGRRSVHEGIGFTKFKQCLQQEFEESLAIQGAPGAGNVRGIGGEERVEKIDVPGKGTVEVFRLSAQFPGPTTPRDFVTLLVTSDNAMSPGTESQGVVPRHYMMISKPVNHAETQPRQGFIRGSYESVEFIREVPRRLKTSMSTTDLDETAHKDTENLSKDATIRAARQKAKESSGQVEDAGIPSNPATRTRSKTAPGSPTAGVDKDGIEEDTYPVEWIMVTRSDPGGSVPRFMVERGTPASICTDAAKFLDWACPQHPDEGDLPGSEANIEIPKRPSVRRDSYQSFRSSRLAGLGPDHGESEAIQPSESENRQAHVQDQPSSGGFMSAVVGTVSAYTPQVVLNHLPGGGSHDSSQEQMKQAHQQAEEDDDTKSVASAASFQSAEDHLASDDDRNAEGASVIMTDSSETSSMKRKDKTKKDDKPQGHHEKELEKLEQRRVALTTKFAESRSKLDHQVHSQSAKEEAAHQKAIEKHKKDLAKHEEKYTKELKKIEERAKKEREKLEEKQRKQEHKSDLSRLTRERDDARKEAELAKKEAESLQSVIADLQKKNTDLVAELGQLTATAAAAAESTTKSGSGSAAASLKSTSVADIKTEGT